MNDTLKIKYSKKQLRYALLFGVIWIVIYIFYALFRPDSYFGYGYLVMAIVFFAIYIHKKIFHYASIKNGILTRHTIFPKRIRLRDITEVDYFAGKYTLQTNHSTISINTMELDANSIKDLKKILDKINTKP